MYICPFSSTPHTPRVPDCLALASPVVYDVARESCVSLCVISFLRLLACTRPGQRVEAARWFCWFLCGFVDNLGYVLSVFTYTRGYITKCSLSPFPPSLLSLSLTLLYLIISLTFFSVIPSLSLSLSSPSHGHSCTERLIK